jgi:hypothetical protein
MKAHAKILIYYKSPRDGLKSYGKVQHVPELVPGDLGYVEPLHKYMIEGDKTQAFYPSKWGSTWFIRLSENQIELLQNQNQQ